MEKGKKIGILTFHREINAGANLQAYALIHFLKNAGFNAEIIDYIPNSEIDNRNFLRKTLHFLKTFLVLEARRSEKIKKEFRTFQDKHYLLSVEKYYGDNEFISSFSNKYDILVSGSDQILNLSLSGNSIAYYLPVKNVIKISYGSSFGREVITHSEEMAIKQYLCSFMRLSFREESAYKNVSSLIDVKEKNIVLDPVFLLSKYDWQQIARKNKKTNYIVVYCMETSEWMKATIEYVHELYPSYEIIIIFGSKSEFRFNFKYRKYNGMGPSSFVSLINGCDLVVTNSFHGIAFSMLFEKYFYCCAHSSRNTRLETLLDKVGESEKIIYDSSKPFSPINGAKCMLNLKNKIEASKQFLFDSLK